MVFSVGIDIENPERFIKYCRENPISEMLTSIFTPDEVNNYSQYTPQLCYALSFSCKEAFFKALGSSWTNSNLFWTDIELLFSEAPEKKKPALSFQEMLKQFSKKITYNFQ